MFFSMNIYVKNQPFIIVKTDPDNFSEDEIRKFKSVPVPVKKFSAEYSWREEDPTVSTGWPISNRK